MKTNEAISKRILELCKERDITPNKLGTISGLDPSTITSIFYRKSIMSLNTLYNNEIS